MGVWAACPKLETRITNDGGIMKNGDKPAYPVDFDLNEAIDSGHWYEGMGLTKREKACIELGVPETGDRELDEIIRKAERKKVAMAAMQGLLSNSGGPVQANSRSGTGYCNCDAEGVAKWAVENADALLKELEQTNEE